MRKLICFLLSVLLLLSGLPAALAAEHYKTEADFSAGDYHFRAGMDFFLDESSIRILSDLFPGFCLSDDYQVTDSSPFSLTGRIASLMETDVSGILTASFRELADFLGSERETGRFAGDVFGSASEREVIRFSVYDFAFFYSVPENLSGLKSLLGPSTVSLRSLPQRRLMCEAALYDGGEYASLTVYDADSAILTCSADLSPEHITLIAGYGAEGKTYYEYWSVNRGSDGLDADKMLYADDLGQGYPSIDASATISRESLAVRKNGSDIAFEYSFEPANGAPGITASGTLFGESPDTILQCSVGFGDESLPSCRVTVTKDDSSYEAPEGIRTVRLDSMAEADKEKISREIKLSTSLLLLNVFSSLPEPYQSLLTDAVP